MNVLCCGTDFPHNAGEFCERAVKDSYFISRFSTPFVYESDGKLLTGNPGDILLMPAGTIIYHGPQTSDEVFINDWIYVSDEDFRQLLDSCPLPEKTAFSIGDSSILKNCIARIHEELLLKQAGYEEMISAVLTRTIISIYRLYQKCQNTDSSTLRIESVREAFLRHPEKEWTLQDMADMAKYSVSRFCSLYYQKYGSSPKADLLIHRMNLAKQLLLYSDCTITEISNYCGFQSIYYFSKYFKEREGCSPSEYARLIEK